MASDDLRTVRGLARKLKLAPSTVSLALRNSPLVNAQTRARVVAAARRAGYRANPLASALMARLRRRRAAEPGTSLAWLLNFPGDRARQAYLDRFVRGGRERAEILGLGLEVIAFGDAGLPEPRLQQVLHARNIEGLIIGPLREGTRIAPGLEWDRYALATVGWSVAEPAIHRAVNNQYNTARRAYLELWRRGYRHIGLNLWRVVNERVQGAYRAAFCEVERELRGGEQPHTFRERDDPEPLADWCRRTGIDALLTNVGAEWSALHDAGIRVPEDLALVTLAAVDPSAMPPGRGLFAGMDQREEIVGSTAVDLVVEQMLHLERGVPSVQKTVSIDAVWRDGWSVTAPSHRTLPS